MPPQRPELGDFISLVCLKSIIAGMEETFGVAACNTLLNVVGRKRGIKLAQSLGLNSWRNADFGTLAQELNQTLGIDGTRLVIIERIEPLTNGGYRVFTRETICSTGELSTANKTCAFTAGVIQGILEMLSKQTLNWQQTPPPSPNPQAVEIFEFTPIGNKPVQPWPPIKNDLS